MLARVENVGSGPAGCELAPAATGSRDGVVVTRTIRSAEELEILRDDWHELLRESQADRLFLTWEWLYTWWKHLGGEAALEVASMERDGRILALAPLLRRALPSWVAGGPPLEFLGSGHVGSDYLDLLVRRGQQAEVLDALATFLARRSSALTLERAPRDGSAFQLAGRLGERGWLVNVEPSGICPFIPVQGRTFGQYLASLGPSHRYNFRRRLRNLHRHYRVHLEAVQTDSARRRALGILVSLHYLRWRQRGGTDAFHRPELVRFHEEMSSLALARGWLRLYVMWLDGRPAAALYGFLYRGILYFYQSGFDPVYRPHSVGLVLLGLAIERAFEEGAREFDLLHGDEGYKFLWARDVRDLVRLEIYPPDTQGFLAWREQSFRRAVRKIARRVLPRPIVERLTGLTAAKPWEALDATPLG